MTEAGSRKTVTMLRQVIIETCSTNGIVAERSSARTRWAVETVIALMIGSLTPDSRFSTKSRLDWAVPADEAGLIPRFG